MSKEKNTYPLVLVGGIFSYGDREKDSLPRYFLNATDNEVVPLGMRTIIPSISPFATYWIRAMQLIAQVKGIRVDLTERYAHATGLKRYGRDYSDSGFYPEWSEENPVHLVTYSAGGLTAHYAQYILANDLLGIGSNANWVKSISNLSSPHNGTPWVGFLRPVLGLFSLYTKFTEAFSKKKEYGGDWEMDAYDLQRKEGEGFFKHFARVFMSDKVRKYNLAKDMLLQESTAMNKEYFNLYPDTYYFNYCSYQKFEKITWLAKPIYFMINILPFWAFLPKIRGWGKGAKKLKYWKKNDGAVPVISQYGAWTHNSNRPRAHRLRKFLDNFSSGQQYYSRIDFDHLDYFVYSKDPRKVRGLFRYIYGILEKL